MNRHLAIDAGRYAVKVVGTAGYRDMFPSYVGKARSLKLQNELRSTDSVLKTPFGEYFIGDIAKDEAHDGARLMTASKVHNDTRTLVLAAVARAVDDGDAVTVTTGVPVEFHTANTKRDMSELLAGAHVIEINGRPKRFTIGKVRVSVEGPSCYMTLSGSKGGRINFLDFGSRTINYGVIVNGRYIDRESGTLDYGCDTVGGDVGRRAIADLSRVWRDFRDETHMVGGGAMRYSEELARYFPRLMCATSPQFANAMAFWTIGELANGKVSQ